MVAHGWQSLCRFGCHAEAQWSFEITALCNKDLCSLQQLVSSPHHCCVKLHQKAWQLCSQSDHLTSHMSHVHKPTEGLCTCWGPDISTWQIVGCYFFFFQTETLFKRDGATVGIAQRPHSGSHIWQRLTCSSSHENSAPFQFKHIQRYIITNSATQYVWESVFSSRVRLWCVAKLSRNRNISCFMVTIAIAKTIFLNSSNSHSYLFSKMPQSSSHHSCSTPPFFCSHTLTVNRSCLWLAEVQLCVLCLDLYRVGLSSMKFHLLYPADCTKSTHWIGGLYCTAFSWQSHFLLLFC